MSITVTSEVETDTGALPLAPGDLVGKRYAILRLVARGGMGVVYEARNIETDQRVALKCLRPERALSEIARARFGREAKLLERMTHENIVRMHGYGVHGGHMPFIVMEYLDGMTLDDSLKSVRRPPLSIAVEIVTQICRAVACAHALDIAHRDLKPANIMLVQEGTRLTVKLLDFGIGARTAGVQTRLTASSADLGTACYMSPEQARGEHNAGKASDVYAIGLIFYELLSGKRAYSGGSYNAVLFEILTQTLRPIQDVAPDCPHRLRAVIDRSLAVDLGKRYPDALVLSRELDTALSASAAEPTVLALTRSTRSAQIQSWLWALGAAIVVSGVAFGRTYVASHRPPATASLASERTEQRPLEHSNHAVSAQPSPAAIPDSILEKNPAARVTMPAKRRNSTQSPPQPTLPRPQAIAVRPVESPVPSAETGPAPTLTFQTLNPY